jgi:anti-sigma-K factor RskA
VRARLIARLARPQARRWGRGRSPLSLKPTLAASLVVLVLLNLALLWQNRSLALQQQDLLAQVEANRTALAMLSYPEAETVRVQGEGGRGLLIYDPQGELAVLSIWDLPELPKGQAYQAWLIEPSGERVSAGLFIPERGKPISILLHSPYPLRDFVGFGVTIEPAGGSAGPTGPRVLAADL